MEEMLTGHKIVKAYGREEHSLRQFDAINAELYSTA